MCIGINFAKIEIKALVTHILGQYDFELALDQEIIQFYRATGMPLHGIKMGVFERSPTHAYSGVIVGQEAEPVLRGPNDE